MDLRQLRYFLAVADAGGFSRGAERVHVAQPALSAHVARLEEELGVSLFVRNAKGAELTHAGSVLVEHAQEVLRRVRLARDAVRHASDEIHGEVTLGLPATVSGIVALPLLNRLRAHFPQISLRLLEGHSGWLHEWLLAGRLDAAVLFGAPTTRGLQVQPLLDEDLYLVSAPPRDGEPWPEQVEMADLGRYPLLLPAQGHGLRTAIDRAALMAGVSLDVALEVDSLATMRRATAAGFGHTVLSYAAVADEVRRGELVARRIEKPTVVRSVVCVTRDDRCHDVAQIKTFDLLRSLIVEGVESGRWPGRLRL